MQKFNLMKIYGGTRHYYFLLLFCFVGQFMIAQNQVKGVVLDSGGTTLPGVNIIEKGTKNGVVTDFDGNYSISVQDNASIVFSYVGFDTQEIKVSGKQTINVTLKENLQSLDEVLVIGYGTQKRDDVNSAVSTIKAKELEDVPQVSVDQLLQGRAAGVIVTNNSGQPGGNVSVKIRGASSLGGSNEPLYIIDGVPISGDATNQSTSGRPISASYSGANAPSVTVSPLSLINPNDIESLVVLKDASATAIYGSRGANGVVIITTKSGKKGSGKFSYDTFLSTQQQTNLLKPMNLRQYATQQNALAEVFGNDPRPEFVNPSLLGNGTDWQDEIYKTAILTNHQLSFSGGSESTTYYLSAGFTDQEGTVIGSGYKRYNFKTNLDSNVKSWLKVGANISSGISNEKITLNGNSSGIIGTSLLSAPDAPVRDINGEFSGPPVGINTAGNFINPVAQALLNTNKLLRKSFMGNVYSEVTLFKGLVYRFEIGANTEFTNGEEFRPTYVWGSVKNEHATFLTRTQNWYSINVKNLLTYKTSIGKNNFNVLLGQEANDNHWEGNSYNIKDFASNDLHTISLGDQTTLQGNDYKGSASLSSYFGRLIYDFDNKYGLSASIRADGSSKFDKDHKWGYFPSVAATWKLSNESFMEGFNKYVDNIKIRVGYGETGNQNVQGGQYASNIQNISTNLGLGYFAANIANPFLQWETSKQTNIGLDFKLFDSKFSGTVDVYRKISEGFLFPLPLPGYLTGLESYNGGISSPLSNIGSMENKGIDISLGYSNKFNDNFSWNTSLTLTKYVNKLVKIVNGVDLTASADLDDNDRQIVTNTVVGEPIGQFYGYQSLGIIRTQEQLDQAAIPKLGNTAVPSSLGDIEYKDNDGDGYINENDKVAIGNPNPNFTFGFNNSFKYKGLELAVFLQGSQGNKILNLTRRQGTLNNSLYRNQLAEAADFWSTTNTDASLPRPLTGGGNANVLVSDRYVEDGSYLRIQNITFSYSLPYDIVSKIKMSNIRVYTGVQNLYTFTKYKGYDPEVGSLNQNVLLSGIDNGRYPTPRTITLGLNIEF
jgi:TonB-linked SusC/RagA family outer membrane protein